MKGIFNPNKICSRIIGPQHSPHRHDNCGFINYWALMYYMKTCPLRFAQKYELWPVVRDWACKPITVTWPS